MTRRSHAHLRAFAVRAAAFAVSLLIGLAGCQHAPIVVKDHTPEVLAPIDTAATKLTHAQTQIATGIALTQKTPDVAAIFKTLQQDVGDALEYINTAKVKVMEWGKIDVATQQLTVTQANHIKVLEEDFWSVRQHRIALILKILVGLAGGMAVVASIIVFTHPSVGALGFIAKSAVHIGMFIVTGSIHFWVWLVLLIRNRLHHATPGTPAPVARA